VSTLPARILLVLILAVFAGALGYAYSSSQPKRYSADMKLEYSRLVSPDLQLLGGGYSEPQIDENIRIATEAAEVSSFDVAEATAKAHPDLGSANQIAGNINVAPVRDTLTVVVTAHGSTPDRAARLARNYGDSYVAIHNDRIKRRAAAAQRVLEARYAALNQQDKAAVPGANLRFQINTLQVLRRLGAGEPQIIEAPRASSVSSSPNTPRNVIFGLLFGLVVGIGLVALRAESPARAAAAAARRASAATRESTRSP
jgi:capsular polysaccharide biosynthesis protein